LIDYVKVLRPTQHKIGHFRDVLPSQSLGNTTKSNMHPQQNFNILNIKRTPKTKARFGRILRSLAWK